MEWSIKKFNELSTEELYRILQERTAVFVVEQNCPYLEVDGKDLESYHLMGSIEGELVAYLRILPPGVSYPEASLGRILVKSSYRKNGYAEELVSRGIDFIHTELQENVIKIQAQDYLRKFYGSFGFISITDVYLEDNIPHIDMILEK
ncbi:GNAT family N-acetyltransferase [Bacillus sp. B1-b2]|uniref:GNAT family N-acetyltransferase n=1 Tax=Bacillus sp. B1-b2 TaxID=2653201 RepID=UPI001262ABF6|nr:GNAT family N-acetyltransferase [Bacillus sp. B1-b2]KAB7672244.1 GNAT family N-acetyltransferase [Bacillus sp. B1-b2]